MLHKSPSLFFSATCLSRFFLFVSHKLRGQGGCSPAAPFHHLQTFTLGVSLAVTKGFLLTHHGQIDHHRHMRERKSHLKKSDDFTDPEPRS